MFHWRNTVSLLTTKLWSGYTNSCFNQCVGFWSLWEDILSTKTNFFLMLSFETLLSRLSPATVIGWQSSSGLCLRHVSVELTERFKNMMIWASPALKNLCVTKPAWSALRSRVADWSQLICGRLLNIFVLNEQNTCELVQNEGRREEAVFYQLCTNQRKPEVCPDFKKRKKRLATVITDIPLSLLTTGLLCDLAYICVRYCTYNKTNTCTLSPVG